MNVGRRERCWGYFDLGWNEVNFSYGLWLLVAHHPSSISSLFITPSMPFSSLNLSHLWPELMRTLIQMKTNWEDVKAFLHLKGFSWSSFVQVCTPPDPSLAFPNPSLPRWPSQIIPWGEILLPIAGRSSLPTSVRVSPSHGGQRQDSHHQGKEDSGYK